ncbi:VOC family protein [Shimazuella sp. AN120528]|uniref:VOC family protein n=1 Tax=Shimazuella soli TaxID=1892854 RepID=UPI001F0DB7FE|nr:VOC family protein [Shimazuella soli]MCH5584920.1 VOC family protein [Shimazuella soli]
MQKIIPHLWFDQEAKEAAEFYISAFGENSRITNITTIEGTPSGNCDIVSFVLAGQKFMAISAGPHFQFNPSVSFTVHCHTAEEVDSLWDKLFEGATALMPLASYPFSERYGWLQDKYGLSWQIMYNAQEFTQKITPALMFTGDICGKAEEAINFYVSVFHHATFDAKARYEKEEDPDAEGMLKFAAFTLEGQKFSAMDSSYEHGFSFNEAISFLVLCEDQTDIDYYWEKLSAVPEAEQCGWLRDKYGLSWQISPQRMEEIMQTDDKEKLNRVTKSFLKMKKFDLAELEKAYQGK